MDLVSCRVCNGKVAESANACPHCGVSEPSISKEVWEFDHQLNIAKQSWKEARNWLWAAAAFIFVMCAGASSMGAVFSVILLVAVAAITLLVQHLTIGKFIWRDATAAFLEKFPQSMPRPRDEIANGVAYSLIVFCLLIALLAVRASMLGEANRKTAHELLQMIEESGKK